LKSSVFPAENFSIQETKAMVDELLSEKLILTYVVDGKEFWRVTGWHHQAIEYPSYRYPRSKEFGEEAKKKRALINNSSPNLHRTFTEPSLANGENGNGEGRNGEERIRSFERTPDKIFDFDSETPELKNRVTKKANGTAKRLWPTSGGLSPQNHAEVLRACYLSEILLSQSWLEEAIESVLARKPRNSGAYFRKCLSAGAEKLGYDFHVLILRVILPAKKPKPEDAA
jgi:hypothetical protein